MNSTARVILPPSSRVLATVSAFPCGSTAMVSVTATMGQTRQPAVQTTWPMAFTRVTHKRRCVPGDASASGPGGCVMASATVLTAVTRDPAVLRVLLPALLQQQFL